MDWTYLSKRIFGFLFSVFLIVTTVFFLIRSLPGDPAVYVLGELADPRDIEALRVEMGLTKPISVQYFEYLNKLFMGDLGVSISRNKNVVSLVTRYFASSMWLASGSLLVATFLAMISVILFLRDSRKRSFGFFILTSVFSSAPLFFWAPFGILFFSIKLRLLPVSGADSIQHFILPSFCLGLVLFPTLARLLRATLLNELKSEYIRTAFAKGLGATKVVWIHAFKNTLVPTFLMWANLWGSVLAGAVVTETLFDWPGLGKLFYGAFQSRDYPLIQGIVIAVAVIYSLMQLLVDLVNVKIDPRMRVQE
jgi:ABC-type dipeptide/oligopeptide/nickel transport system permease component